MNRLDGNSNPVSTPLDKADIIGKKSTVHRESAVDVVAKKALEAASSNATNPKKSPIKGTTWTDQAKDSSPMNARMNIHPDGSLTLNLLDRAGKKLSKTLTASEWINNKTIRREALEILCKNEPNSAQLVNSFASKLGQPMAGGKIGRKIELLDKMTLVSYVAESGKILWEVKSLALGKHDNKEIPDPGKTSKEPEAVIESSQASLDVSTIEDTFILSDLHEPSKSTDSPVTVAEEKSTKKKYWSNLLASAALKIGVKLDAEGKLIKPSSYDNLQELAGADSPINRKTVKCAKQYFAEINKTGLQNNINKQETTPIDTLYWKATEALKHWNKFTIYVSAFLNGITCQGFLSSPKQILRAINHDQVENLAKGLSLLKAKYPKNTPASLSLQRELGSLIKTLEKQAKEPELNENTKELLGKTLKDAKWLLNFDPKHLSILKKAETPLIAKYQELIGTLKNILDRPIDSELNEATRATLAAANQILNRSTHFILQSKQELSGSTIGKLQEELLTLVKKVENKEATQIIKNANEKLAKLKQNYPTDLNNKEKISAFKNEVLSLINSLESINDLEITDETYKQFTKPLDEAKKLYRKLTDDITYKEPPQNSGNTVEL